MSISVFTLSIRKSLVAKEADHPFCACFDGNAKPYKLIAIYQCSLNFSQAVEIQATG